MENCVSGTDLKGRPVANFQSRSGNNTVKREVYGFVMMLARPLLAASFEMRRSRAGQMFIHKSLHL